MNDTMSLEDLQSGIHKQKGRSTISITNGYDISVESAINLISEPISEDFETYAMEAFRFYHESEQFGLYATQGLETLGHEVKIIRAIKDKYNVKRLDPYGEMYGLEKKEEEPAAAPKKANIFKRIWMAIVEGFRRLIMAVGNAIRQFMNFMSSKFVKGQIKFYENHKEEIGRALLSGVQKVINVILPKKNPALIPENLAVDATKMVKIAEAMDKDISTMYDKINGVKPGFWGTVKAIFSKAEDPKNKFAGRLGNLATPNKKGSYTNPAAYASMYLYGTEKPPKPNKILATTYLGIVKPNILSKESVNNMGNMIKAAKSALKVLNKSLDNVRKAQKAIEKAYKTAVKSNSDSAALSQANATMAKYGNFSRTFNGYIVGVILHCHKEFLRHQHWAGKACRMIVKESKKAPSDKTRGK